MGRVAGAGAVLWGPVQPDGTRAVLRVARVSLPGEEYAQVAEAWGLRLALLLLLGDLGGTRRSARIVGDNLAVVRYGASQGRLHQPDMQGVLEQVLARVLLLGWDLQWAAVRQRFNQAADYQAGLAVDEAEARKGRGETAPGVFFG